MEQALRVTVWNEGRHEKRDDTVRAIYPNGMHAAIADYLKSRGEFEVRTATLDEPQHGLTQEVLDSTDVLTWWGHMSHDDVDDEIVHRVHQRVLAGMGIILLHSAHFSKVFKRLMGTHCSLKWRSVGERERLWNVAPDHPITEGIGDYVELPHVEMYGERFDIPEPDRLIFLSWFEGGEVFRSGCVWNRGHGKVFYFRPGDQEYPIYHNETVLKIIANACRWARPTMSADASSCTHVVEALERLETGRDR